METRLEDEILQQYGARLMRLHTGEMLFGQGEAATHLFYVKTGRVKMSYFNERGREFIQGYFVAPQSFGEPPFFAQTSYPASATATEASEVWKIGYNDFLRLLRSDFSVTSEMLRTLSERLIHKSTMLSEVALEESTHLLTALLRFLKKERGIPKEEGFQVPFTRQQLADMTGLRVETVIRTIKLMEQQGIVQIVEGKIFVLPRSRKRKIE